MKKFYFREWLVALLCGLGSVYANAAVVGLTGNITRIGTGFGGEGLYVSINQAIASTCPNSTLLFMPTSAAQYKETVSIVLAAQAQNRPVTFYYDSAACPSGSVPTFIAVGVI